MTPTEAAGDRVTTDAEVVFALTGDGRIQRLDAATGQVPGDKYDRLVAVVPW